MHVRTVKIFTVLLFIVGLMVTACAEPAPKASQVTIALSEFAFNPQDVTIPAGQVNFTVQNNGTIEHNFVIEGVEEHLEFVLPMESDSLDVTLSPGVYTILCTIAGHKEAGMEGTLTVEE